MSITTVNRYGANLVEILSYDEGKLKFSAAQKLNGSVEEFWIGRLK